MSSSEHNGRPAATAPRHFATTHWTVVLTAGRGDTAQAQPALEALCRTYWYPLYTFVRHKGHSPEDAQDLTQEFFARLVAGRYLDAVDRSKGKFRSFLLASLSHFLANEGDRARAQKRGGGRVVVSLDAQAAEARYRLEPAHDLSADRLFDRRWALALLDDVLRRLHDDYARDGKGALFEQLRDTLTVGQAAAPYADLALALGMSVSAVKVAVHRLRRRYREVLRATIADTLARPEDADEELRHLFAALSL